MQENEENGPGPFLVPNPMNLSDDPARFVTIELSAEEASIGGEAAGTAGLIDAAYVESKTIPLHRRLCSFGSALSEIGYGLIAASARSQNAGPFSFWLTEIPTFSKKLRRLARFDPTDEIVQEWYRGNAGEVSSDQLHYQSLVHSLLRKLGDTGKQAKEHAGLPCFCVVLRDADVEPLFMVDALRLVPNGDLFPLRLTIEDELCVERFYMRMQGVKRVFRSQQINPQKTRQIASDGECNLPFAMTGEEVRVIGAMAESMVKTYKGRESDVREYVSVDYADIVRIDELLRQSAAM